MAKKEGTLKKRIVVVTGKRKTAVARVRVKPGLGKVTINKIPLDLWQPEFERIKIREPLLLADELS